jgi:hypothetical protein
MTGAAPANRIAGVEPQITALATVRRLAAIDPDSFGDKQHSIVQRLLKALRRKAAELAIAETAAEGREAKMRNAGVGGPEGGRSPTAGPPTPAPLQQPYPRSSRSPPVTFLREAIRGVKVPRRLTAEAAEQRVVDAPIHVDQPHLGQMLVAREAARGLAGDGARGVGFPIGLAAQAPGIVGEALHPRARLVRCRG